MRFPLFDWPMLNNKEYMHNTCRAFRMISNTSSRSSPVAYELNPAIKYNAVPLILNLIFLIVYSKVSISLSEFHKWVKDVVRNACEEALIVEGFVPDPVSTEREGMPDVLITVLCSALGLKFIMLNYCMLKCMKLDDDQINRNSR